MAKKLNGHQGKVQSINTALKAALNIQRTDQIPPFLTPMIQKTATDMCMLDKVAEELQDAELITTEVGSMGQQKPTVNPLVPYYDKLSSRVTDDLYNLGLTARKQAQKVEVQQQGEDKLGTLLGQTNNIM